MEEEKVGEEVEEQNPGEVKEDVEGAAENAEGVEEEDGAQREAYSQDQRKNKAKGKEGGKGENQQKGKQRSGEEGEGAKEEGEGENKKKEKEKVEEPEYIPRGKHKKLKKIKEKYGD